MPAFDRLVLRATHNSYSGNAGGARGTILEQLRAGVRALELDMHAGDFATRGDYGIGHDHPGDNVWTQGSNPSTYNFRDWAAQIAAFSRETPRHLPIALVLDLKDSLNRPSANEGNHGALNAALVELFGTRLVRPFDVRDWPAVDLLLGRVLVVLSGDAASRAGYSLDRGATPSVAINGHGQVIEVHESEAGNHGLWYWTGQLASDGTTRWQRHGRYGRGTTPAVALHNDGWIVEVHKSEHHDRLWYHLGRLTSDLDVTWLVNADYDDGVMPTIRFDSPGGFTLREIHRSQAHNQNWDWRVALDPVASSLAFTANGMTTDPRWNSSVADAIAVQTMADDVLVYSSSVVDRSPISYEPIAFVEYQEDDDAALAGGARFAAADAGSEAFLVNARLAGLITRAWQFSQASPRSTPPPQYPATDDPFSAWYAAYCQSIGAVS
jgi:hypothetical protein